MKRAFISITLAVLLISFIIALAGCGYVGKADDIAEQKVADVMTMGSDPEATAQMGETAAEGQRRHARNHRLNRQAMMEDIDAFFHLDRACRTTERVIP